MSFDFFIYFSMIGIFLFLNCFSIEGCENLVAVNPETSVVDVFGFTK